MMFTQKSTTKLFPWTKGDPEVKVQHPNSPPCTALSKIHLNICALPQNLHKISIITFLMALLSKPVAPSRRSYTFGKHQAYFI